MQLPRAQIFARTYRSTKLQLGHNQTMAKIPNLPFVRELLRSRQLSSLLITRMKLLVDFFELRVGQVCVNLGGSDISMP